ncbi:formate dehydrogenase accessory sulfurtransferase FdhD [Romboutsia maritimum]|uniref:Protein FdhD n=1 Tax=Romboutsia maritimum TaxID=2020948 RepID=A0A371IVG2_9FIRM|nr:formate dehydrogenase accessory sulfurtransferase FdhD [Romboutsia maritimum]
MDYKYKNYFKVPIVKIEENNINNVEEFIISEYPLSFILNDKHINTFLCTPSNLEELIVGFLVTKRYITKKEDIMSIEIDKENRVSYVKTQKEIDVKDEEILFLNSLDYISYKPITDKNSIDIETIYEIMQKNLTSSKLFKDTGGVHSVAIFDKDKEIIICEDVARHNAMDKAIGYCILNDINLEDKVVVVSGRISLEMILKSSQVGVPIVISKSAPTNLSIEISKKLNITLIGFVRGRRMNIYTNSYRVETK